MNLFIVVLIGFTILVFIYNYLKMRKRRKNQIDTVAEYHRQFDSRRKTKTRHNLSDSNYKNYITKSNSKIDYISKDDYYL